MASKSGVKQKKRYSTTHMTPVKRFFTLRGHLRTIEKAIGFLRVFSAVHPRSDARKLRGLGPLALWLPLCRPSRACDARRKPAWDLRALCTRPFQEAQPHVQRGTALSRSMRDRRNPRLRSAFTEENEQQRLAYSGYTDAAISQTASTRSLIVR
jgi:hypothetical protein